ncbi:MAG: RHS repeat-associated core domain-containing protein [Streptomyces sp.]|uniref:RHS repeat-associated core domain-containing protein n=1 Tax=Streptomyces sp. TaxID=1931 RepID=UPI003D6B41D7
MTPGTAHAHCHGGITYGAGLAGLASPCGEVAATAGGVAFAAAAAVALGVAAHAATTASAATAAVAAAAAAVGLNATRGTGERCQGRDPVDLATGEMFSTKDDVTLEGALPLVLRRTYVSGYEAGGVCGPSWASTLDQRLERTGHGLVFFNDDAMCVHYPDPAAAGSWTMPVSGPRWPLHHFADGTYALAQPESGLWLYFAASDHHVHPLSAISDLAGHRITFHAGPSGLLEEVRHTGGQRITASYEGGLVSELRLLHDGGGHTTLVRYGYDERRQLTEVVNSSGLPLRYTYDHAGRITGWTDRNGHWYRYAYDESGRVVRTDGHGGAMSGELFYGEGVTVQTDSLGARTAHHFNDANQLVCEVDSLGNTTTFVWDALDRLLSRTDPLGRTTRFEYGDAGNPTLVTRPDGSQVRTSYNQAHLPVSLVEPGGATWQYAYDERGNSTAETDPAGQTTGYGYDERGHLSSVTNALGETTRVRCDAAGLPVQVTDSLGATTHYERDAFGRPVTVTDPLGAITRLEWTVEGKLARQTEPDGAEQTWLFDGEGNCTHHTDANGGVTRYEYTHFDQLAAQTGPDGVRYAFDHDSELRLTTVTNPQGLTWSYAYDPAGRPVWESDFDGRVQTYAHDAAGQVISRTNPLGQSITFAHDALGEIVRKDADGQVITFAYDTAGRPVEAVGPDGEIRWQWDGLGRVTIETTNGRAVTYAYDPLGRITRRVTPSGAVSTFAYDASGNRSTLTVAGRTLSSAHDAAGRETSRRIGEAGLTVHQAWDAAGRLAAQNLTAAGVDEPVQRRTYSYRADGYPTVIDDQHGGPRRFDLDTTGRVTAVHARGWTERYAYDETGNQTHATWPTTHATPEAIGNRAYAGTRITHAGAVRYEHDQAGRITLRQKTGLSKKPDTWRYTWDADDRLTQATTPDGTIWRYLYDPVGRRIAKQRLDADGERVMEQVDFTWEGPTLIEQITTAPGLPHPVALTWEHDGFVPLSQTERLIDSTTQAEIDSRFFSVVTDLVGTPTELVNEQGEIAWRTRTTLWGTTTWPTDSTAYTPLRFPGQYHDPETGLHYNVHRYYDPTTARYTTPDPVGLTGSPDPHAYVPNPMAWTDPLGLWPWLGGRLGPPRRHEDHDVVNRLDKALSRGKDVSQLGDSVAGLIGKLLPPHWAAVVSALGKYGGGVLGFSHGWLTHDRHRPQHAFDRGRHRYDGPKHRYEGARHVYGGALHAKPGLIQDGFGLAPWGDPRAAAKRLAERNLSCPG